MKTTRRPKKPATVAPDNPPPPSTATDWDLWMEKHADEIRGNTKRPAPRRRPRKRRTPP
jgi:hypothetical protein